MSRKGKSPVAIPAGVEVKQAGDQVIVKGPKGSLEQKLVPGVDVKIEDNQVLVLLDEKLHIRSNMHGLYRALINNMVEGVSKGFEKKLEMIGVGYRAAVQGNILDLQVGLSFVDNGGQRASQKCSQVVIPKDIVIKVEKNTLISISGVNKQQVGQIAAEIRAIKPPEPYKGKGIRYVGEHVRKKAGKAAAKK